MSGTTGTKTGGNTKPQSKREIRGRNWFLTINNPSFSDDTKIRELEKYCFQYEKGESGTIHIQAVIGFKNPISFNSVKKMFNTAHIEPVKSINEALDYCNKSNTSISCNWSRGFKPQTPIKIIKELRPFQQKIVDNINFHDDRKINWYYDTHGNIGKTSLAKYLCVKYNALYVNGKGADMRYAVANWENKNELICIFGFARSLEGKISYTGIEDIKDGLFFSGKYESSMTIMNSPYIICLANWYPDTSEMSKDRWNIIKLDDNEDETSNGNSHCV